MLVSGVPHNDLTFAFPSGSAVKNLPAMQDSQTMWVWSLGWKDPLEEGMATHFNILAWRIPWTEEPGKLQSMGLQTVRHSWNDLAAAVAQLLQSCPTLSDPMDCSLPGSSIHGIFQARVLESGAITQLQLCVWLPREKWVNGLVFVVPMLSTVLAHGMNSEK